MYIFNAAREGPCSCLLGEPACPAHPTDLVFALEQSREVTEQQFAQMKAMASALLGGVRVRGGGCAGGARVAVLAFASHARQLLRFSDGLGEARLLRAVAALPFEPAAAGGDLGEAMRFVSRHVFKRARPGPLARRVATFFSSGRAAGAPGLPAAAMELGALGLVPVVVAFGPAPSVERAFAVSGARFACDVLLFGGRTPSAASVGENRMVRCGPACALSRLMPTNAVSGT